MLKGFIHQSSSPLVAPVVFAKKSDEGLWFCIDYRDINSQMITNRYCLPLIPEMLNLRREAKTCPKLDIRGACYLLRGMDQDEHKLPFRTRYGLFEPTVILFGTTNAHADFPGYINNTIREAFDGFASTDVNDILIYSTSEGEHEEHDLWVMQRLLDTGLYLKPEECKSDKETMGYLGLIISTNAISMDEDKLETVRNLRREWQTKTSRLNNPFEVHQFLAFCNRYPRCIPKYSEKVEPLTTLTTKDEPFQCESEQQCAVEIMVPAFTMAPVLGHCDLERNVIIETDASDYVSTGVLSQYDDEGVLHPVAYDSKKHPPAECNSDIYDTELMAIIQALEQWRSEWEGAAYPLQLLMDHKTLENFTTKMLRNRRQARSSQYLNWLITKWYIGQEYPTGKRMLWRGGRETSLSGGMNDWRILNRWV